MSSNERYDHFSDIPASSELISDWVQITQDLIDAFSRATLDPDPMHVDPEWAASGPFGGTIAFGFQTMSMLTYLLHSAMQNEPHRDLTRGYYLNYGFDRLRLVSPVPVGSRIRGRFRIADRQTDDKGRTIATFDVTIEREGAERPALAARWLGVWVPPGV